MMIIVLITLVFLAGFIISTFLEAKDHEKTFADEVEPDCAVTVKASDMNAYDTLYMCNASLAYRAIEDGQLEFATNSVGLKYLNDRKILYAKDEYESLVDMLDDLRLTK